MASFEGKVIAVTGAASGIGLATAQLLASRGATLALADQNESSLNSAAESLAKPSSGSHHSTTVLDVRDVNAVNSWITSTVEKCGKLDGAANIAGVHREHGNGIVGATDDDFDFVFGINGKGVFNCVRAELRAMDPSINSNAFKPSKPGHGASIVNLASVAGQIGIPTSAAYCMSKHAVIGLTKVAAREHGSLEKGSVRVNAVCPGVISTPMVAQLQKETGGVTSTKMQCLDRQAEPEEVAQVVVFLLSGDSSFVNGCCYNVDGGWTA